MSILVPYCGAEPNELDRYRAYCRRRAAKPISSPRPAKRKERQETELTRRLAALPIVHFVGRWPTVKEIVERAARFYDMPVDVLLGQAKSPAIVEKRHIVYTLARVLTRKSTPTIGKAIGRDHSTIIHGLKKTVARAEANSRFSAHFLAVEKFVLEGRT